MSVTAYRLIYTSDQVVANQPLGKSPVTDNLHLPVQLGNRKIHSRLKKETIRIDNISQQQITTQPLHVQTSDFLVATV